LLIIAERFDMIDAVSFAWDGKMQLVQSTAVITAFFICTLVGSNLNKWCGIQVPDCEAPEFWAHMDKLVALNGKLSDIGKSSAPQWQKNLQKVPILQQFAWELGALFFGKSIKSGTYDAQPQTQLVY